MPPTPLSSFAAGARDTLPMMIGAAPFAAIFGALDSLHPGETMRFANDHDPLPLLAQIAQRYGDRVSVEYLRRESGNIVIDFRVS